MGKGTRASAAPADVLQELASIQDRLAQDLESLPSSSVDSSLFYESSYTATFPQKVAQRQMLEVPAASGWNTNGEKYRGILRGSEDDAPNSFACIGEQERPMSAPASYMGISLGMPKRASGYLGNFSQTRSAFSGKQERPATASGRVGAGPPRAYTTYRANFGVERSAPQYAVIARSWRHEPSGYHRNAEAFRFKDPAAPNWMPMSTTATSFRRPSVSREVKPRAKLGVFMSGYQQGMKTGDGRSLQHISTRSKDRRAFTTEAKSSLRALRGKAHALPVSGAQKTQGASTNTQGFMPAPAHGNLSTTQGVTFTKRRPSTPLAVTGGFNISSTWVSPAKARRDPARPRVKEGGPSGSLASGFVKVVRSQVAA